MRAARERALWQPEEQRRWRVGDFVPAPALPEEPSEDEAALDAFMLEHYRRLE